MMFQSCCFSWYCPHRVGFLGLILATTPLASAPTLRTVELACRGSALRCEIADTPAKRQLGLMHRTELPRGTGMLFIFPSPGPLSFWMRHTSLPLSIAYLDAGGTIRELHDLYPFNETPVPSADQQLLYAIEVPQGWWRAIGAKVGDRVSGLSSIPGAMH